MSNVDRSAAALWDALLNGVDDDELDLPVSSTELNEAAATAVAGVEPPERIRFRLDGASIEAHHVALRTATRALSAFQDAVTSAAAAVMDRATVAGRVPSDILRATELQLAPLISPGSVVFTMVPAVGRDSRHALFVAGSEEPLLDVSVARILDAVKAVEHERFDDDLAGETVRGLGARTQKHLSDLSRVLISEDLDLDVDWRRAHGRRRRVRLDRRAAARLKAVVGEKIESIDEETLTGWLVTVSSEEKQTLRLEDGTKVNLEVSPELQSELGAFFDHRVRVVVRTRTETTVASGATRESRLAESISLAGGS